MESLKQLINQIGGTQNHKIDVKVFRIRDLKWVPFYKESENRELFIKFTLKNENQVGIADFSMGVYEVGNAGNKNQTSLAFEVLNHAFLNY